MLLSWHDLSLRRKGLVVVALPLFAGLLSTSGFVWAQSQDRRAATAMTTNVEVNAALAQTLKLVIDNETGVRGYLLTLNDSFLEPYTSSRAALPAALDNLDRVLAAAGEHQGTGDLRRLVDQRLNISERLRNLPPPGELIPLLDQGKATTDQIRARMQVITDQEAALLAQHRAESDQAHWVALLIAAASGLVALCGGVTAVGLFTRSISRRVAGLEQAAQQLEQGQPVQPLPGRDELARLGRALARASSLLRSREAELRAREQTLQSIFTASPDAIHIIGLDGRVELASPAGQRITGFDPTTELGEPATARVHPDDLARAADAIERLLDGTTAQTVLRYRSQHADGRWLVLESQAAALTGDDHVDGVVAITRDVTDRARLEQAERDARAAAEAANYAKSEFLSRMSHELRTPLNAVLGFAQLLELEDLSEQQRDDVGRIIKAGRHLLDLINEVLDISRIETGRLALSPEAVCVADVIYDAADLVRSLAADHGVEVILPQPEACAGYVHADQQRFKQVLLNLLSNAVKYNRPGGSVTIQCRESPAATTYLDVIDTGVGIKAEHLALLFTPFERLGAEQTEIEGIGIGLALARRLTEAMDGRLTVASTPGQGSTFTIEIPQTTPPQPATDRPEEAPNTAVNQAPNNPTHTILHIEDNLSNVTLVERIIAQRPHSKLIAAMQGNLGLDLAAQHPIDLVLLDIHLPDINGMEVLQRLRSQPHTADTPIIIISADATPRQVDHMLAAGATAYLTKPINIEELLRLIDQHLPLA